MDNGKELKYIDQEEEGDGLGKVTETVKTMGMGWRWDEDRMDIDKGDQTKDRMEIG